MLVIRTEENKAVIELGLIDLHIITRAFSAYERKGYQLDLTDQLNESHAGAAEELHDKLLDLYTSL